MQGAGNASLFESLGTPPHAPGSIDLRFGEGVFRESIHSLVSVAFQQFKNSERNGSTSSAFVSERPPSASEPDHFEPPCDAPDGRKLAACLLPVAQRILLSEVAFHYLAVLVGERVAIN
jgi:hypothetical protein